MRSILDWAARTVGITAEESESELAERARCVQHRRVLEEKRERIDKYFWEVLSQILYARGCKISLNTIKGTLSFNDIRRIVSEDINLGTKDTDYNLFLNSIKRLLVDDNILSPWEEITMHNFKQEMSKRGFKSGLKKRVVIPIEQLLPDLQAADTRRSEIETEIYHLQALREVVNELK